jgi:7-cyano-7-deazaguanine synthase
MPIINLLWTGGLDSTFRLCHLSHYAVTVQPYYITEKRKSMKNEIRAMDKIRTLLSKNCNKEFSILPTIYVDRDTIAADAELTQSWNVLHDKYVIGSQYEYIARFAKQQGIKLEVGIEFSPRSKAATALKSEGGLARCNYLINSIMCKWGGYLHLDATQASIDMINIFGNMQFPELLFSIDKLEEIRLMREWGLNEVVMTTWFCHNPVLGKPCGRCNPCRDALNEGLAWRVPLSGRILGTLRVPFIFALRALGCICRGLWRD